NDVDGWISHFGGTTSQTYINFIKSLLSSKIVTLESDASGDIYHFYPYAEVANTVGGAPGDVAWAPVNNGNNYPTTLTGHRKYNTEYRHSIDMTLPTTEEAGESVNITLKTTDGSIFIQQPQKWYLTINGPDGMVQKLNGHSKSPNLSTRAAE